MGFDVCDLHASIVLYHNSIDEVRKTINSFLATSLQVKLFLVDNSSDDRLSILVQGNKRIEYIFNGTNFGYGKAHNIALRKSIEQGVRYHLVLNPDVLIHQGTLESLGSYMNEHPRCANIMPQVLYPDGSIQHLCKRLPTPMDLFLRRFVPIKAWKELHARTYELRDTRYDSIMNVPSLSGCFMFLRVEALKEIGAFDEHYFMYMEDVDLNRRLHIQYETLFYPLASITHGYEKASYKNKKLLWYHICSAWFYFNKWGWYFDRERDAINASSDKLKHKGNF